MQKRPVALIILDGFGLTDPGPGNAVAMAHTPNFDEYWSQCPHTQLQASGPAVGLPEGQMGNSEVGHLNLGAGRIVKQSLTFISDAIKEGDFAQNPVLSQLMEGVGPNNALHLMGLVSRGRVHSDLEHLFALMELAKSKQVPRVYLHAFTDGRDTAPDSGLGYLQEVVDKIKELDYPIDIATVSGRYFAMDRDKRWQRLEKAYLAVVEGQSKIKVQDPVQAIRKAYDRGETDEFITPTVVVDSGGEPLSSFGDGDAVCFFNFRADRARQMSHALLAPEGWDGFERPRLLQLEYASLMEVDDELDRPFAFRLPELRDTLPQVLAEAGLSQYHSAETEKYPHVTYFFNALNEEPCPEETRAMVASPKVATYDLQPEMSAPELTQKTLERLRAHDDDFLLVNFANPDMVGHTGVLTAAIKACEAADAGMGQLVDAVLKKGGAAMIVADHGNAEMMIDVTGGPHTAHTTNLVPCIIVGAGQLSLKGEGKLGDVAPTLLSLLGLDTPEAMTGHSLLVGSLSPSP